LRTTLQIISSKGAAGIGGKRTLAIVAYLPHHGSEHRVRIRASGAGDNVTTAAANCSLPTGPIGGGEKTYSFRPLAASAIVEQDVPSAADSTR
jgi:hypothetical protein